MPSARLTAAEYRALLLDPEGYVLRARRSMAWTKLERLALHARSEMVQLMALKEMLSRIDPVPREQPQGAPAIAAVQIVLNGAVSGPARAELPADGVRLHLSGGNGHSA